MVCVVGCRCRVYVFVCVYNMLYGVLCVILDTNTNKLCNHGSYYGISFSLLPSSFFPYHGIVQDLSRFADFIWVVSEIRFDFVFQSLDPHSTTLFEDSCDQVIHLLNQYNLLILTPASTLFHHELMLGFMRPFSKHLRLNP